MSAPDRTGAAAGPLALPAQIHATALIIGECGLLIRGKSGSGKSALARTLLAQSRDQGSFSCLIGDDIVRVSQAGGLIVARPHPEIAGRMEVRGLGILNFEYEPAAVLRCVVDLENMTTGGGNLPRIPEKSHKYTQFGEVFLPRLQLPASCSAADNAEVTLLFLEDILHPAAK